MIMTPSTLEEAIKNVKIAGNKLSKVLKAKKTR